jgi:metal-responsive CopG/Arc/MetJ family transcriptional regulator
VSDIRTVDKTMVSVQLDKDLLASVDKAATRRGISRSEFIRKALSRVIAGEPDAS